MKKTLLLSAFLAVSGAMNAQWVTQNTNFFNISEGVNDIQIVNPNTVWALGYDGSGDGAQFQDFTRTTDGGNFWESGLVATGDSTLDLTNISAVSATTAWVGAVSPVPGVGGGGVWKTSDGGVVWTRQNPSGYTTPDSFFNVVHFWNENVGITQGDPINGEFEVYRTTDGGTTWAAVPAAALPDPGASEYGYNGGNVAAGNSFWFVTNQGKLYRTTDTGISWTKLNTPISDFSATNVGGSLFFSDDNNGILVARTGPAPTQTADSATYTLYKTSNGGTTWSAGTPLTAPYKSTLSYIPGTSILVGTGRTISGTTSTYSTGYSTDNGSTWTQIESGVQRTSIAFFNGTTGWSGGFTTEPDFLGGIYKYNGPSLGVSNFDNKAKVSVYPNPANDVVNIKGASISKVVAFDILGKQVVSQDFSAQDEVSVNVSSLRTGMYVLQVTNDLGATETIKFAKK